MIIMLFFSYFQAWPHEPHLLYITFWLNLNLLCHISMYSHFPILSSVAARITLRWEQTYFIFWLNLNLLSPRSIYSCYPIFSTWPDQPHLRINLVYDRSNIVFLSKFHISKRGRTNHTSMRANLPSGAHQDLTCRSTW